MPSYRLHAQIIGRSDGQSAVAAAAYRAGAKLHDERLDEPHDYTRKGGVLHSEIMAPDNTPAWMLDRQQLWNAVERIEDSHNRRATAQLSREIQLSLPHELDDDARQALVRQFVAEEFVAKGMIADVNIHRGGAGDERNYHAHVMLTMRELTGEGFGKKAREWNDARFYVEKGQKVGVKADKEQLIHLWRERWAEHENRALEKAGIEARVDHRSYADRGIDKEPQKHLGKTAHRIERMGEESRIGNDNRAIMDRNAAREEAYRAIESGDREAQRIAFEKLKFATWENRKRTDMATEQMADKRALADKAADQRHTLQTSLERMYGPQKTELQDQASTLQDRIDQGGLRGFVRGVFGLKKRDQTKLKSVQEERDGIAAEEERRKAVVKAEQEAAAQRLRDAQAADGKSLSIGIQKALRRRDNDGWQSQQDPFERAPRPDRREIRTVSDRPPETPSLKPPDQPPLPSSGSVLRDQFGVKPPKSDEGRKADKPSPAPQRGRGDRFDRER